MFFEAIILVALFSIVVVCWRLRELAPAIVALVAMYPSVASVLGGLSNYVIELPGTFLLMRSSRLLTLLVLTAPALIGWLVVWGTLRHRDQALIKEPPTKPDGFTLKEVQQLFLVVAVAGGVRMFFFTG